MRLTPSWRGYLSHNRRRLRDHFTDRSQDVYPRSQTATVITHTALPVPAPIYRLLQSFPASRRTCMVIPLPGSVTATKKSPTMARGRRQQIGRTGRASGRKSEQEKLMLRMTVSRSSHPNPISARTRSHHSGRIESSPNPKRDPSIAAVIPVQRQPSKSKASGTRSSPDQDQHRNHWGHSHEEDDPADDDNFTNDESPSIEGSEWEDREFPRKRRRGEFRTKTSSPVSTGDRDFCACTGAPQHPSNLGFTAGSDETQEIFGRGIFRVQPHGPRRAYFFTFLPDTVDLQPTTSREAYDDRSHAPMAALQSRPSRMDLRTIYVASEAPIHLRRIHYW